VGILKLLFLLKKKDLTNGFIKELLCSIPKTLFKFVLDDKSTKTVFLWILHSILHWDYKNYLQMIFSRETIFKESRAQAD
jgi:hypothetical protein